MNSNYEIIIQNIEAFIRKYHKNTLLKGSLYLSGLVVSSFLIFIFIEFFFSLGQAGRTILFYSFLAILILNLVYWIIIPLLKLLKIVASIKHDEAARMIGAYFPEIGDKLINTLQLNEMGKTSGIEVELINASIAQKANNLSVFKFSKAIDFKMNRKYLKYAVPPIFITLIILFSAPSTILSPAERIFNHDKVYVKQPSLWFHVKNKSLTSVENSDFEIKLEVDGKTLPNEVFITLNGYEYLMNKKSSSEFTYIIRGLKKDQAFSFKAGKNESGEFLIKIIKKPVIIGFDIQINYPAYTRKKAIIVSNSGDITVPEGSVLTWKIKSKNTSRLHFNEESNHELLSSNGIFNFSKKIINSLAYSITPTNANINKIDSMSFVIQSAKDAFPEIRLEEMVDSVFELRRFFNGYISDDYGFSSLKMIINYTKANDSAKVRTISLPINQNLQQSFYHYFDFNDLSIKPGSELFYYFEIADNDGVNGVKKTKSQSFTIRKLTTDEQREELESQTQGNQNKLEDNLSKAKELNEKINKLSDKIKGEKNLDWDSKKQIENVIEEYKNLQSKLNEELKKRQEDLKKSEELGLQDESLIEKQKELNQLLEELFTPEMKEMMKELEEMLKKQANKAEVDKMLENMKNDTEYLEKELERNIELLKQMKLDLKLQNSIDKLDELAKEQKKLANETPEMKNSDDAKQKQDSLNKEFNEVNKMLDEAKKLNDSLSSPMNFNKPEEKVQDVKNSMDESSKQLKSGKKQSATKSQNEAAQKMEELKESLEQMQEEMEDESAGEDIKTLQEILENLVEASFEQETLINEIRKVNTQDPKYPGLIERQKKLNDNLKMIQDSLDNLAKRQPSVAPFISKEIRDINTQSQQVLTSLKDLNTIGYMGRGSKEQANAGQQRVMTSINNLSLMLNESLNQMKQQSKQNKSGKGNCKKPKPGGGKSMKSIRQAQEELSKQMEKMKQEMQKGEKPGGQTGQGKQSEKMSEELAKMAAQQEALRKKLSEYEKMLQQQGNLKEAQQLKKIGDQMEKNETDIVNKMLTNESLLRQKEILTRLLEAENAEREREMDEKRKSNEGKDEQNRNINKNLEYKTIEKEEIELLKSLPPNFNQFYRNKVNNYFKLY